MTVSTSRSIWAAVTRPSLMPFLRPLAPPRAASVQQLMRLSSSSRRLEQAQTTIEPPSPQPEASRETQSPPPQQPYFVNRTHSHNLPVYLQAKRGGNLRQTVIRKIEGDPAQLKIQLEQQLGLDPKTVAVNQLTNHVVIKGWHKPAVMEFLEKRHF